MRDTIYRDEAVEVIKKWFEKIKLNPDILIDSIISIPSADRPHGYWIKLGPAEYRCSECGKIQYADDENELNYCCCCGSHNKIRRVIGVEDEESV